MLAPPAPASRKTPRRRWRTPACRRRWPASARSTPPSATPPSPPCPSSSNSATSAATSRTTPWANLDFYLETYADNVERAGGKVHWCSTTNDARAAVLKICRDAGARTVTKGKSMISEELGINEHLEKHDIAPVETDLGEYIYNFATNPPATSSAPPSI